VKTNRAETLQAATSGGNGRKTTKLMKKNLRENIQRKGRFDKNKTKWKK
jgi:hypothetical protein